MILHDCKQRSDEWYALRAGMPTASEFSKIVTSKGDASKSIEGYAVTLAGELYAGRPVDAWEGNQWTERGAEMEAEATAYYEFVRDSKITAVGFVTDDNKQYGCSPDGIVKDDNGLVEIKCLKAEKHTNVILRYRKDGTIPPDYIQQTQGQMMICGADWCDLIFYHPDLPSLIIRQKPIKAVVDGLQINIPTLLSRRDEIHAALMAQAREAA